MFGVLAVNGLSETLGQTLGTAAAPATGRGLVQYAP